MHIIYRHFYEEGKIKHKSRRSEACRINSMKEGVASLVLSSKGGADKMENLTSFISNFMRLWNTF